MEWGGSKLQTVSTEAVTVEMSIVRTPNLFECLLSRCEENGLMLSFSRTDIATHVAPCLYVWLVPM